MGSKFQIFAVVFTLAQAVSWASSPYKDMPVEKWVPFQAKVARENLFKNISPQGTLPGTVLASPSKAEPDYYFHWVRDAALVMDSVVGLYEAAVSPADKKALYERLVDYISISRVNQGTPNKSGGLGEPKFLVSGQAFTGAWGRPQNDGPALRASTLMRFAKSLTKPEDQPILAALFDTKDASESIIRRDLDFLVAHRWETCFDLWEEAKGYHFYTQLVQRRALLEGADLALQMGATALSEKYRNAGLELEAFLGRYWDEGRGYLLTAIDLDGGINYKTSGLDSSIILSVLHGRYPGEWRVDSPKIEATALQIEKAFKALYPINKGSDPGVAVGRYPEDRYNGYHSKLQGHAWVLIINAFAEYYYTLASRYSNLGRITVTPDNEAFIQEISNDPLVEAGLVIHSGEPQFQVIIQKLIAKADSFLERQKFHAVSDGSMAEQINRNKGHMQGAPHLTWSYASFITASQARARVYNRLLRR